jgi:hypothetical protein
VTSARPLRPGPFFVQHPVLFALSLLGASATSGYSCYRAAHTDGPRRIGFAALGVLTAAEAVGIVVLWRRARG